MQAVCKLSEFFTRLYHVFPKCSPQADSRGQSSPIAIQGEEGLEGAGEGDCGDCRTNIHTYVCVRVRVRAYACACACMRVCLRQTKCGWEINSKREPDQDSPGRRQVLCASAQPCSPGGSPAAEAYPRQKNETS